MKNPRVLIVDDKEQVRRDLRAALTLSGGLEVVGEATDGKEAVSLAESLAPDVILMDLEMPVMDGYESTRMIKASRPSCKVIALTVHDYEAARAKAHQAGVDAFIVKGVPVEKIIRIISNRKE
ncbi:MAG: response regulator transcription factor [Chloroflexi bacterium]|nr:response regulator transcription factor [Chloroflexota bacterium]